MHCQRGCGPLLTFTPHDRARTHSKHEPISETIPPSLLYSFSVPPPQSPPCPRPTTHHHFSRCHLGWIQQDGTMTWGLRRGGGSPPSSTSSASTHTHTLAMPLCHYLQAGFSSAAPASSCLSSSSDRGERLPEEPRARPLLYQHPLMWPAPRFLSGELSVKSTLRCTEALTHAGETHRLAFVCQECRYPPVFSTFGRV